MSVQRSTHFKEKCEILNKIFIHSVPYSEGKNILHKNYALKKYFPSVVGTVTTTIINMERMKF